MSYKKYETITTKTNTTIDTKIVSFKDCFTPMFTVACSSLVCTEDINSME